MSTFAAAARLGRVDGVRPQSFRPRKARKEVRKRPARDARHWPAWTDEIRFGVPDAQSWPSWTSEVRIALGPVRKGR